VDQRLRRKLLVFNVVLVAGVALFLGRTFAGGSEDAKPAVPEDAVASMAEVPAKPRKQVHVEPKEAPSTPVAAAPVPEPVPPSDPTPAPAPVPVLPVEPPSLSNLPLTLLATSVTKPASYSSALVADSTARSSTYWRGDVLPGAGPIVAIAPRYVDFVNNATGKLERIDLGNHDAPRVAPPEPVTAARGPAPKDELSAQMDKAIVKTDDTHYKVDRAFVDQLLANPTALMTSLRARPVAAANGQPGGLKLSSVRPNSAPARIGLQNGDIITSINGNDLGGNDYDRLLEMYTKLKSARALSVQVNRGGKPLTLDYAIQ
jgi:type II secretory pathway component PulC